MNRLILKSILMCFLLVFTMNISYCLGGDDERPPIDIVGTVVGSGDGGNGQIVRLCLDDNDQLSFTILVQVVNLSDDDFVEIDGEYYYGLPSDVPEMLIEFSLDGINFEYVPVNLFQAVSASDFFEVEVTFGPYDFGDECANSRDNIVELDEFHAQLVTPVYKGGQISTDTYEAYPIGEYNGVGEIFEYVPCATTRSATDDPCDDVSTVPSTIQIDCLCDEGDSSARNSDFRTIEFATISPNPAAQYVKLQFNDNSRGDYHVDLLGLDGKIHQKWSVSTNNSEVHKLDLSEVSTGLYIIRIKSGKEYQTLKLFKQ